MRHSSLPAPKAHLGQLSTTRQHAQHARRRTLAIANPNAWLEKCEERSVAYSMGGLYELMHQSGLAAQQLNGCGRFHLLPPCPQASTRSNCGLFTRVKHGGSWGVLPKCPGTGSRSSHLKQDSIFRPISTFTVLSQPDATDQLMVCCRRSVFYLHFSRMCSLVKNRQIMVCKLISVCVHACLNRGEKLRV